MKLSLALLAALYLGGCQSVEDKDAKCQHIGSQPRAAVSSDDAVWFKKACDCNDTIMMAAILTRGIPVMNPCYYPGSKHHQEVLDFQARVDAEKAKPSN